MHYPEEAKNRLWKYMLSAFLEFNTGADINRLSSKYFYDDEGFRGEDVLVTNGYDLITDYLAQTLDIRLNTPVSGIDYTGQKSTLLPLVKPSQQTMYW
ncbi:MAG: FAD-dependent oxidoreductase [Richelia sp. SM2_1_7]|nr:FAD-dependent oxidoreductase [Richelia sp. SM2_1_7]